MKTEHPKAWRRYVDTDDDTSTELALEDAYFTDAKRRKARAYDEVPPTKKEYKRDER